MGDRYLKATRMLDYEFERIKSIYGFVRDDILFGYNIDDDISASRVLSDGYGQCNTKHSYAHIRGQRPCI